MCVWGGGGGWQQTDHMITVYCVCVCVCMGGGGKGGGQQTDAL